jgi:Skp family chaperone for outer membrane proteins
MQQVSLEHISPKNLNNLEHSVQDLLAAMRKAKLMDEQLQESLKLLERKLGETRRARFDKVNQEYQGY